MEKGRDKKWEGGREKWKRAMPDLLQGLKFVEEGCDGNRVDGHHEDAEAAREHPKIQGHVGPRDLDDADDRKADDGKRGQQQGSNGQQRRSKRQTG